MVEEDAPLTPVIDPLGRDRKGETDGASVADEHALLNDTRAIELTSNVDKGDTAQDAAPDAEKAHWGRVVAQSECNPQPDEEPLAASLGRQNSSSIEQKGGAVGLCGVATVAVAHDYQLVYYFQQGLECS
jgi:hypothetical protein